MLMDWPIETLHSPGDVYENIDEQKLDCAVDCACALIEDIDKGH